MSFFLGVVFLMVGIHLRNRAVCRSFCDGTAGTIPNAVPPLVSPRGPRNGHNRGAASTAIPNPRPSPRIPKRRESKPPLLSDGAIDRGDILREALQDDAGVEWEEEVMTNTMRIKTSVRHYPYPTGTIHIPPAFIQLSRGHYGEQPPSRNMEEGWWYRHQCLLSRGR